MNWYTLNCEPDLLQLYDFTRQNYFDIYSELSCYKVQ